MKTQLKLTALALLLATVTPQLSTAFAQGALTPPGAPAATMKSLDQIEARTPISSAPFTITQSGSYYLTTNLTVTTGDGIDISTNGVTLDLNGYTISSTAASATGTGILLNSGLSSSGLSDITICNGHIRGGVANNGSGVYGGNGFGSGIIYSGNPPVNVLVSRVSVAGCQYCGIYLDIDDSTVVESCTVLTVGSDGIYASTIKQSTAIDCGSSAIYGVLVSDCRGQSSSSGDGVYASTVQNCYGSSSSGDGVYAYNTALNCNGYSSSGYGVIASTAQNCNGSSSSSDGINATIAQNCNGSSSGSNYGIYVSYIANGCYGYSNSGTGLDAFIANSCSGNSLSITHNLNCY